MPYIHTLLLEDVIKQAKQKDNQLQSLKTGGARIYLVNPDNVVRMWADDITAVGVGKYGSEFSVPQRVLEDFRRYDIKSLVNRGASLIDEAEIVKQSAAAEVNGAGIYPLQEDAIKSFTPPRFTWSYTSLNEFLTCPAQWAAKRYYKTIKDVESEAMRVGNLIHETAEHYGKSKTGQKFSQNKIHGQYLPMVQRYVDALVASGAELHFEKEMCFDKQMKLSHWKAWDTVWVRSKADVLAKKAQRLSIVDWKTGKYKEDFLQLEMFAVFAALTPGFEDVQEFDPKFIFTKEPAPKNILRLPKPILRSELKPKLLEILTIVRRMEAAWESENFPAKKNGLCRSWCSNTDCTHCGG